MVSKMKEVLFKDFITLKRGYDLPTKKRIPGTVPIVSSSGITGVHNDSKVQGPGVITGRSGLIGEIFYTKENFWPLNTTLYVKNFKNNCPEYVYYFLKTLNLNNYQSGSSVPTLNRNHLNNIKIKIHDIKDQVKISNILTNIDEKIENNNNTLANLEELSQTLFKRWFVDFEFPDENGDPYKSNNGEMYNTKLGEIPTKFYPGTLKDLLNIKSGYAFKSSWWKDTGTPVIKIKDIQDNNINLDNLSYVAPEYASKANNFTVSGGEILMALTGATVSKNYIVPLLNEPALVNQRVGLVMESNMFKYSLLNSDLIRNEIIDRAYGSAQPNVSPKNILAINFPIPNPSIIEDFLTKTKDIYEMIYIKSYENTQLAKIRDTLLPKLMSGEIELPDDLEVDEHAELLQ